MAVALEDREDSDTQIEIYRRRHKLLRDGFLAAGYELEHSEGSLYIWAKVKHGNSCWDELGWLSERGILVAPGEFYDESATNYIRVSTTASDTHIAEVVARIK
jgi:aspartate/methionine/tyrosine aminotransferase